MVLRTSGWSSTTRIVAGIGMSRGNRGKSGLRGRFALCYIRLMILPVQYGKDLERPGL